MVLDAAWAPVGDDGDGTRVFATAGRDKLVKVWARKAGEGGQFELGKAVTEEHPVTALDFVPEVTEQGLLLLAVGTEGGKVSVLTLKVNDSEVEVVSTLTVSRALALPRAVLQLAWRPTREGRKGRELAIAGEDGSLRIYSFRAL
jgi:elongator complex protein 2